MKKSLKDRIIDALQNTEDLPTPSSDLVPSGAKVLGRVSPATQAMYYLIEKFVEEAAEAQKKLHGTPACGKTCPCLSNLRDQQALQQLFFTLAKADVGYSGMGIPGVYGDWNLVENPIASDLDTLGPLGEMLKRAGLGGDMIVVTGLAKLPTDTQDI